MSDIRYIKLKNEGGFVARIQIQYKARRVDHDGNVSFDAKWQKWHTDGYRDICVGQDRTVDIADAHIPDGSFVRLKAEVILGDGKLGDTYVFQTSSTTTISYKISGTTLSNTLSRI